MTRGSHCFLVEEKKENFRCKKDAYFVIVKIEEYHVF